MKPHLVPSRAPSGRVHFAESIPVRFPGWATWGLDKRTWTIRVSPSWEEYYGR